MPIENAPFLIAVIVLFGSFMIGLGYAQWQSSQAGSWAEFEKRRNAEVR